METRKKLLDELDYWLFKIEDYISCDEGMRILDELRDCAITIGLVWIEGEPKVEESDDLGDFDQINYDGERDWLVEREYE